jgi:hypothetical protein
MSVSRFSRQPSGRPKKKRSKRRFLPAGALDAATGALALWPVVASVVYTGGTLTWLSLGEAIGFAGLAIVGLVAHELKTKRIVHQFEAIPADARDGRRSEELQAAA